MQGTSRELRGQDKRLQYKASRHVNNKQIHNIKKIEKEKKPLREKGGKRHGKKKVSRSGFEPQKISEGVQGPRGGGKGHITEVEECVKDDRETAPLHQVCEDSATSLKYLHIIMPYTFVCIS